MNFKVSVKKDEHVFTIKLGNEQHEIERKFGKPDAVIIRKGKKSYTAFEYFDLKLRLFFNAKINTLELIRFGSNKVKISSTETIGQTVSTMKNRFSETHESWDEDKYQFITVHYNELLGITLFEEYGVVTDVEYGDLD